MELARRTTIGLLLCLSAPILQAAEPYLGRFLYQYEGGDIYRITVPDDTHMTWECVACPEPGTRAQETPDRFRIAEGIYFVSWLEASGVSVTQVVDLNAMKVWSTVIDGPGRYVIRGDIVREQ